MNREQRQAYAGRPGLNFVRDDRAGGRDPEVHVSVFDLLFIAIVLVTVVTLLVALAAAIGGRPARAGAILRGLAVGLAAYLAIVAAVGLASPPRVWRVGERRCFDDWCVTVDRAQHSARGGGTTWTVTLTLSSRALGRPQRENGAGVLLVDGRGRRYPPARSPAGDPMKVLLQPGESATVVFTFQLPADAGRIGLVIDHGWFPGLFIIGDDESLFHGPTVAWLD